MLIIRLQRTGTKNKPDFRIVLAESFRASNKKFLEVLGNYNPRTKNFGIKNQERLKYWLDQNVALSPSVHNLLVEKQLFAGKKVKAWAPKKKKLTDAAVPQATAAVKEVKAKAAPVAKVQAQEPEPEAAQS
ncbi:MAG: 30S ribosomal protein S16 [Candidatus Doudnabacteria bacterium]|nr:30S ribosomal protein S16 [Candidatus Doudnabacteria bacterium]